MKNISFLYSLIIIIALAFGSCSRKYGCYYSNYESTENLNKCQEFENSPDNSVLNPEANVCVQSCP
jgi:hypothetical protein